MYLSSSQITCQLSVIQTTTGDNIICCHDDVGDNSDDGDDPARRQVNEGRGLVLHKLLPASWNGGRKNYRFPNNCKLIISRDTCGTRKGMYSDIKVLEDTVLSKFQFCFVFSCNILEFKVQIFSWTKFKLSFTARETFFVIISEIASLWEMYLIFCIIRIF